MTPMVDAREIVVRRGNATLLDRVSLSLAPGAFLVLAGANGAGKSTLLRCLLQVVPHSGRLLLDGRDAKRLSARERARTLAYVPQLPPGDIPFTVREFVAMARYPHWTHGALESKRDREAVDAALARTRTEPFASRLLGTLSGGERQKVYLAAALAQETPVLLLDEPTAHLDYARRLEIEDLLVELRQSGDRALIVVLHDIGDLVAQADSVLALRNGRTVYTGAANGFLANEPLEATYGLPFDHVEHSSRTIVLPRRGASA